LDIAGVGLRKEGAMRFMLLMTDVEGDWDRLSSAEQDRIIQRHEEVQRDLEAQGKFVSTCRLRPGREAKTVKLLRDGRLVVTDGPFVETKESVGGYYIIDCAAIDEAVEWAKRLRFIPGCVEVRAVWE
jgi:hypothetical protein